MGSRLRIGGLVLLAVFGCLIAWQATRPLKRDPSKNIMFRGKSLDAWFYGSRSNFFSQNVRDSAQNALIGVGSNAVPFLLSQFNPERASPTIYYRAYRVAPAGMKARLPYPIAADDIRAIVFGHLWQFRGRVSRDQLHYLADATANFENPRLRLRGLMFLTETYQIDSGFLRLCRRLLEDPEPAIQLQAAIPLAESAIRADPNDTRLAPILLAAFATKGVRDHWVDLNWYGFQQDPPGGAGGAPAMPLRPIPVGHVQDENEMLRIRIKTALIRLEPYLTAEQRARFHELNTSQTNPVAQ